MSGNIFYSLGSFCFGDFYKNGKLVSLPKKTKLSYIPIINSQNKLIDLIPTKQLKGGYIDLPVINMWRRLRRLFWFMKIQHKNKILNYIFAMKENYIDRMIDYLFGYYRNPIVNLLKLSNIKKFKKLYRDHKWKRNRKL